MKTFKIKLDEYAVSPSNDISKHVGDLSTLTLEIQFRDRLRPNESESKRNKRIAKYTSCLQQ